MKIHVLFFTFVKWVREGEAKFLPGYSYFHPPTDSYLPRTVVEPRC